MASEDSALQADSGTTQPRLRLGETGWTGLKISQGIIQEERRKDLRWPASVRTYKTMVEDATISAAVAFMEMMLQRVPWRITLPPQAKNNPKAVARAAFLQQCMADMEHSWFQFIAEVSSTYTYGFCINEKVFRRRLTANGSKYNDNLIGIRKLPVRSQDTVYKWGFDDLGRNLTSVTQMVSYATSYSGAALDIKNREITLPREKFLLFRTDVKKDNPEGNSPLNGVYNAWKYRTALEETEAISLARGLGGLPYIKMPARFMTDDATPAERAIYDHFMRIIRNIQSNEQSGLILPSETDPDSRLPIYDFNLVSPQGGSVNPSEAIARWDNKILTKLFSDFLKMGQERVGSYSLADSKSSLVAMAVEHRLNEIKDVLNNDLRRQLFALNGWSMEDDITPEFDYGDLESPDWEEWSKAIQRVKSVGLIVASPDNVNHVAEVLDLPHRVDEATSVEAMKEMLGDPESKAGEGMKKGSGNGTSNSPAKRDNSASNSENSA